MKPMLQDTDARLAQMTPPQRWGVIVLAAVAILFLGWQLWLGDTMAANERHRMRIDELTHKIADNKISLLSKRIEKLKKENMMFAESIERHRAMARYLQAKATEMSFFLFDRRRFMEMFEKILRRSVELGIRIDAVETRDEKGDISTLIEKKKRLTITGAGPFAAVTKLTWFIESFGALMKITRYRYWYDSEAGEPKFLVELIYYGAKP